MLMKNLVDAIAIDTGLPKKSIRQVMESIVETTQKSLVAGESVRMFGLGCMSVVERGPKSARNIRTGEKVMVPARKVVVMSPSDALLKSVNAGSPA
jgi:DNA-binding protein HU-beta